MKSYVPWVDKSQAKFINNKKKVSTDRASMILRKHEQSVLQSVCSIYKKNFWICLFHYMHFIFIENALSKTKPMQKSIYSLHILS